MTPREAKQLAMINLCKRKVYMNEKWYMVLMGAKSTRAVRRARRKGMKHYDI